MQPLYYFSFSGLCSVVSALKHSFIDKFEVVHFQDSLSNACDVLDKLKSLAVIRKLMIDGEVDTRCVGPAELEKVSLNATILGCHIFCLP